MTKHKKKAIRNILLQIYFCQPNLYCTINTERKEDKPKPQLLLKGLVKQEIKSIPKQHTSYAIY